jgi:hypothetical protein
MSLLEIISLKRVFREIPWWSMRGKTQGGIFLVNTHFWVERK